MNPPVRPAKHDIVMVKIKHDPCALTYELIDPAGQ